MDAKLLLASLCRAALVFACACVGTVSATGQMTRRATIWDLKIGEPVAAQPAPSEFRAFACGSKAGRRALRCPAGPISKGARRARCLHEIYFEYDDENEYIARAHDNDREINRWAGTAEIGFPIIASALFDDAGILAGIRLVTDPRPDHRNDITEADRRKREDAYLFGGIMAARFMIEPKRDCVALPPAEGEGAVGSLFIKQSCELRDPVAARRIIVRASLYRKPGQSGFNPQMPTQLTQGQFESSARLEIFALHQ